MTIRVVVPVCAALIPCAAAAGDGGAIVASPFTPAGVAPGGAVRLALDAEAYADLRRAADAGVPFTLAGFPLGEGQGVDLRVRPIDPMAPGGRLVIGTAAGDVPAPRPDIVLLGGTVEGEADSRLFLGISPLLAHGYVYLGDRLFILSSGPFTLGLEPVIFEPDAMPAEEFAWEATPFCRADELEPVFDPGARPAGAEAGAAGAGDRGARSQCLVGEMAIDTDWEYTQNFFGGNTTASLAYTYLLAGVIGEIFTSSGTASVLIPYARVWSCDCDPYPASGDRLSQLRSHWNSSMGGVARDSAQIFHALGGGGVAWLSALCGSYAYAASGVAGYFPYPLRDHHNQNWDPMVVTHEAGHNYGAPHTHDHTPQIDGCGTGDCSLAWGGTVMSYCHLCSQGMRNIVLRMHERTVSEAMTPYLNGVPCLSEGAPPAIVEQLTGQTVCEGDPVVLTFRADGVEPVTYTWYRNWVVIPGATGPEYFILAADESDAGVYLAIATDACGGQVSSDPATLTVSPTCPADFDGNCTLDTQDFLAFLNAFNTGAPEADWDGNGIINSLDFIAYLGDFAGGC